MNTIPQSTPSVQNNLTELFVAIDDLIETKVSVGRKPTLTPSECITIVLLRFTYGMSNWFAVYKHIRMFLPSEFPTLGTYKSFLDCMNRSVGYAAVLLRILMTTNRKKYKGIALVDSTPLPVCRNHKIKGCRMGKDIASRGKYSLGWYYGLKLHLCSDLAGNILSFQITTASVGDREYLKHLLDEFKGIFVCDAGYLSSKLEQLAASKGSLLLTGMRRNMKKLSELWQLHVLRKRIRIESVFSCLKLRFGIVSSLPRSLNGLLSHYLFAIFAYQFNR